METDKIKLTEVARTVMEEMGKIPQEMNHAEKVFFQTKVYLAQIKAEKEAWEFVSDRWIYDNLAYASFVSEELFDNLMRDAEHHEGYDKVVYIPIEFPLHADGVRFEDVEFQKQVDSKILEILEVLEIDYDTITWSREERVEKIHRLIE